MSNAEGVRDAATEFDGVDLVLFETLQWIVEQEQAFTLWGELGLAREYRVSEMPAYFVRRDSGGSAAKAYLVNISVPPAGAEQVIHDFSGLGIVHRYDDEIGELSPAIPFDYELNLAGRPTFAMAYTEHNMDRTPLTGTSLPYSPLDIWVDMFVHEGFHHFQYHAPDSDWLSIPWGGLETENYPVTANNIALALLEKHALLDGRDAATTAETTEVLRRVMAIRRTRALLPEATPGGCKVWAPRTHGQRAVAPDGIGQAFTACASGSIQTVRVDVIAMDAPTARLELQVGADFWPGSQGQDVMLDLGENVITLDVPFPVEAGVVYSFGLFPSEGSLNLWSVSDRGTDEAFFIRNSSKLPIAPAPDLMYEVAIEGPNYVDLMDRYQERTEGSAEYVARRLAVLSGNTVYAQERLEQLERNTSTDSQASRYQFFATIFQGGWYATGSTILDLVDRVTDMSWRATFPAGGSPIELLETLYGPLTEPEIAQLVEDAKQAYNWQAIIDQVAVIPPECLDPTP